MNGQGVGLAPTMHIPDGFIAPSLTMAGFALSGAACLAAAYVGKRCSDDQQAPLLGMTAAFIFAAQMLNFPIIGGASGHFLGAVFAALMLGPAQGCLALALVLVVQCLLFADGGLTALGLNVANMAVLGVGVGYGVTRLLMAVLPASRRAGLVAVGVGAWCSVMAAAAACAVELVWSGKPAGVILPALLGIHAVIAVGEALITASAVSLVLTARPDLVPVLAARVRA